VQTNTTEKEFEVEGGEQRMTAKDYRDIGGQSGTPRQFPQPKAKPDMTRPVQNLRGVESVPTSRFPQRKTLSPPQ
jgi:hypothetical protein